MKKNIKGLNCKFFKNIVSSSLGICADCNSIVNKHNQDNVKGGSSKDDDVEDTDETNHARERRDVNGVKLEKKKHTDVEDNEERKREDDLNIEKSS